jgi:hypothetical protein
MLMQKCPEAISVVQNYGYLEARGSQQEKKKVASALTAEAAFAATRYYCPKGDVRACRKAQATLVDIHIVEVLPRGDHFLAAAAAAAAADVVVVVAALLVLQSKSVLIPEYLLLERKKKGEDYLIPRCLY